MNNIKCGHEDICTFIPFENNKYCKIIEHGNIKICEASDKSYNYMFNKTTGAFARWGKTSDEDPDFSPVGPEILDLEISAGKCKGRCSYCYKCNDNNKLRQNMSFKIFKKIFDRMGKQLTQIAFGICDVDGNPDFFRMMEYSRVNGVIPNFTMTGIGLTDEMVKDISELAGAISISIMKKDKNIGYDTIKKLTDTGMKQINIHAVIAEETISFVKEILYDIQTDNRLKNLNAIVFLGIKPKGKAKGHFTPLSMDNFGNLINFCFDNEIQFGFDSCSAPKFEKWVRESDLEEDKKKHLISMSDSCESILASAYINWKGEFFPCSFTEDEIGWKEGINVLDHNFFLDVWNHPRSQAWRRKLLNSTCNGCRKCLTFDEINI